MALTNWGSAFGIAVNHCIGFANLHEAKRHYTRPGLDGVGIELLGVNAGKAQFTLTLIGTVANCSARYNAILAASRLPGSFVTDNGVTYTYIDIDEIEVVNEEPFICADGNYVAWTIQCRGRKVA